MKKINLKKKEKSSFKITKNSKPLSDACFNEPQRFEQMS
jgi:hypothetical protein